MSIAPAPIDNFAFAEWHRLDAISRKHDRDLKVAWTRTVVRGMQPNSLEIRNVFTDCVVETGVTTADTYDLVFNPNSPRYRTLIDDLTDKYMEVIDDPKAKGAVKSIIPSGLSLADRRERLDVFGLDARSAVRLERMRQYGKSPSDVHAARLDMSLQRGNLLALTEINRVVNATIEQVWLDNLRGVSKRKKQKQFGGGWYLEDEQGNTNVITDLLGLPSRARKEIITRQDDVVCDFCDDNFEGATAPIGKPFDTNVGLFFHPPFHPRCRCFMVVRIP